MFVRAVLACLLALGGSLACGTGGRIEEGGASRPPPLPGQSEGVFTTANPSLGVAFRDFLGRRPEPVQPLEFPHNIHVGRQIACTEYCHEAVTMGPRAGLPSVKTCMICHNTIATERPRIKRLTALREQGQDLAWERVFDYPEESHVRFNHAPHVNAEIACSTCHGDIASQSVARRNVTLSMGFCVNCHNERQASVDCLTCHY